MAGQERRSFMKMLAALGAAASLPLPLRAQAPPLTARQRGIVALRIVNTMQSRHLKAAQRFLTLRELFESQVTAAFINSMRMAVVDPAQAVLHGELLNEFRTTFHISTDRRGYTVILSDSNGFALKTDQSGLISEGQADAFDQLASFQGEPLRFERKTSALEQFGARLMTLVFPVVHAQPSANCCRNQCGGNCLGKATDPCDVPCCVELCEGIGWNCCNFGTTSCTWCCVPDSSCDPCIFSC